MQIIGLSLDILGVVLLFISTEILNNSIIKMLDIINYTGSSGGTLGQIVMEKQLLSHKRKASWLSRIGLFLIIIGFTLQLVSYL
ncbi:hypothetical protein [Aurantibacillus circumpalustris]|uniref:hypothetical protein n=1 Tax=Aurantibacillus circumpalustris TaxID=3036359 RepID=UPI00295A6E98|nr:hypothetical protein [Aurantibacillus circumpalustris]